MPITSTFLALLFLGAPPPLSTIIAAEALAAEVSGLDKAQTAALAKSLVPLVEACARHQLPVEPVAQALATIGDAERQLSVAMLVATRLDEVGREAALLSHSVPLMVARVDQLRPSTPQLLALIEHLDALGIPSAAWMVGSSTVVRQLERLDEERRARILQILHRAQPSRHDPLALGRLLTSMVGLSTDDLRELARLVEGSGGGRPGAVYLPRLEGLAREVVTAARWAGAPHAAPMPSGPSFGLPMTGFSAGNAFGSAPAQTSAFGGGFVPAGRDDGGFSESAREALGVLERRWPITQAEASAQTAQILAAIDQQWPLPATPADRLGVVKRSAGNAALSLVEQTADYGPLHKTRAVRVGREILTAEQVMAMIWRGINEFTPHLGCPVPDEASAISGLRSMWRRRFLDSLEAIPVHAPTLDPYALFEALLSALPPALRSDRPTAGGRGSQHLLRWGGRVGTGHSTSDGHGRVRNLPRDGGRSRPGRP